MPSWQVMDVMPSSTGYGSVQFALDGCTDFGPPWGGSSTPAPVKAPTPSPVPAPMPVAAPAPTVTTAPNPSLAFGFGQRQASAHARRRPNTAPVAPMRAADNASLSTTDPTAKVLQTPQPQTAQGGGSSGSGSAFVPKWPYVTAFFCSINVEGTGSLGGVLLVRCLYGFPGSAPRCLGRVAALGVLICTCELTVRKGYTGLLQASMFCSSKTGEKLTIEGGWPLYSHSQAHPAQWSGELPAPSCHGSSGVCRGASAVA